MNAPMTQISSFELVDTTHIQSLNLICEEYQHKHTAAKHYHLAADNNENVFLVALRTVPTDSTGVAHILEHTSLCGSKKYPVRDPFFMMVRRSLNTFMNAFTSSDWTAYPFASQSKKDFSNLLSVYLDAVFFARLDKLDFAQEGCRVEFAEPENPKSDLVYKGVVFNEMKGAMSSITSQLWQAVGESLFPDTTYGHNSGGDPAAITELSYEQLKSFYQTHYHPDNAVFFTYGDIPAEEHQTVFEAQALSHFKKENINIQVPLQKAFDNPARSKKPYAFKEEAALEQTNDLSPRRESHHVCAWVLDDILNPFDVMATHLLASVLLDNSSSPLQKALETSSLGNAPSPLCGTDDSGLQMIFICGLEGCEEHTQAEVEQLILNTLADVAKQPPSREKLESLLDQLELQQREISGDGHPYGLQIILSGLATAMHRGNVSSSLNVDSVLEQLREKITDTNFIPGLLKRLLINNFHRVTLSLNPDEDLAEREIQAEAKKLADIKSKLKDKSVKEILSTTKALEERQASTDDPEILPKVGIEDVPDPAKAPESKHNHKNRSCFYPQGTNGIAYHQFVSPLCNLNAEELALLGLHNRLLTELGCNGQNYLHTQELQASICGDLNAYHSLRASIENEQTVSGYYTISTKGLANRHQGLIELLDRTRHDVRFDEHQRIAELIAQSASRAQRSVTGQGHGLAMTCASQGMSPIAKLQHQTSGMQGISNLKQLDADLQSGIANKTDEGAAKLSDTLVALDNKVKAQQFEVLSIAEARDENAIQTILSNTLTNQLTDSSTDENVVRLALDHIRQSHREIWICNSQVNFCAKAYPTVPTAHSDAAALTVLGGVLRNGFLHTAIREQGGAYGGGASQDSSSACFRFYSYRDPRLEETLNDFDRSIDWLLKAELPKQAVEEAILGVVSSIDKPASPAGTAKQHFHNLLFGRTPEILNEFRAQILDVSEADIRRVAKDYLQPEKASIAVLSHSAEQQSINDLSQRLEMEVLAL